MKKIFLVLLTLPSIALASHKHISMHGDVMSRAPTACTFPDGTTIKNPYVHCITPSQFDKAYGIDQVQGSGVTGKNQTIVLVDALGSPTAQADLDHFSDTFNIPRTTIEFVYPTGAYVNPVSNADQKGWAEETTLDLEWAHAVAPNAHIVNVVTNSDEGTGMSGFPDIFTGIQMALKLYPNAIVSMSLGTGEPTFTKQEIKDHLAGDYHKILKDAVEGGATILASAGDSGSDNATNALGLASTANVSYPASDSYITAVGGTSLQIDWRWNPEGTADDYWTCALAGTGICGTNFFNYSSATQATEVVWNEQWAPAAGGGGVSEVFARPQYQSDKKVGAAASLMKNFRGLPDVSMLAAINGGVEIYTSFAGASWTVVGGTSCASPETAGLIALAGEAASNMLNKQVAVGYLNPLLYALPADDFNDIVPQTFGVQNQVTIDNNALYWNSKVLAAKGSQVVPPVDVPGFSTTPGYDLATGFGSVRAVNFVNDLAMAVTTREALKLQRP